MWKQNLTGSLGAANTTIRATCITILIVALTVASIYLAAASSRINNITAKLDNNLSDPVIKQYGENITRQAVQARVFSSRMIAASDSLKKVIDGPVTDDVVKIGSLVSRLELMVANTDKQLQSQLESSTRLTDQGAKSLAGITKIVETGVARSFEELDKTLASVARSAERVEVYVQDKAWDQLRDSTAGTMLELEGVTKESHGIAADLHETTSYLKAKLIPKPRTYSNHPIKRVLQKSGFFLWDLLKSSSGALLILLRFVELAR